MVNNRIYDIKCIYHEQHDIMFICLDCNNNQPACRKCITSNHKDHKIIDIEDIDSDLQIDISLKYNNEELDKIIKNKQSLLNETNQKYNQIKNNHNKNKNKINQQFKQLHNRLSIVENDLIKQLDLKLKENDDIYNSTINTLENQIETLMKIINDNNNNNNNNNTDDFEINNNQFIEKINNNYKCSKSLILDDVNYKDYNISTHQISIDTFNEIIKLILKIKKETKYLKYQDLEFTIYKDNNEIKDGTQYLAIKSGHHLPPKFPTSVDRLLLPDAFDQSLDRIPDTVEYLIIFNIKHKLKPGSISNSITDLTFEKGFDQKITNDIIPSSVKYLTIHDIVKPLDLLSIPTTVTNLTFDGFKHTIMKGLIPGSVKYLYINDIAQPLDVDSIPTSVTNLTFKDGYKHKLVKGVIPDSVKTLYIHDIVQLLDVDSIPTSVTNLRFSDGFKHKIIKEMIPNSVKDLHILNIEQPILHDSLPSTITNLYIGNYWSLSGNEFKHKLTKGLIPCSVKHLYLGWIEHQPDKDSIPNTVETVTTYYSFKHSIKDILPENTKHIPI